MLDTVRMMVTIHPALINWSLFKNCKDYSMWCQLDNIMFRYYPVSNCLLINTNAHKVLEKDDINLNDCQDYIDKVKKVTDKVLLTTNYVLETNRTDYYVDVKLNPDEKRIFMKLLHKHDLSYRYAKSKEIYDTSVHLNNKSGSFNVNIYDKFSESGLEKFEGIIRFEIQNKKALIKRNLEKYGIPKDLHEYWTKSSFYEWYIKTLEGYLFTGDYYKINKVKDIVMNSSYGKVKKENIIKFVEMVNLVGMENVKKQINRNTIKEYISILNELGVSCYCIDDNETIDFMENMLKRIIRISNEKYFSIND